METNQALTKSAGSQVIDLRLAELRDIADQLPGVVLVHKLPELKIVYMSQAGLDYLGLSIDELTSLGNEYYDRYFHPDEVQGHLQGAGKRIDIYNDDLPISMFQRVRPNEDQAWSWFCTSIRVWIRDERGHPLYTIGIAIPMDPSHNVSSRIARMAEEDSFTSRNSTVFNKLGKREKEVLRLIASGNSSHEIADLLSISTNTVDTHRRNIKRKLKASNAYELVSFARAFNLI